MVPTPQTPLNRGSGQLSHDLERFLVLAGQFASGALLRLCLESHGLHKPEDISILSEDVIDNLPETEGGTRTLNLPNRSKISLLQTWLHLGHDAGELHTISSLQEMQHDINKAAMASLTNSDGKTKYTLAQEFRKQIKLDSSAFPTLSEGQAFKPWKDRFTITAAAQGLDKVLDGEYAPTTREEEDLFEEQQKYMYSVMADHLKSLAGTELLAKHPGDAQAVFEELCVLKETALTGQLVEDYRCKEWEEFAWSTKWNTGCVRFLETWSKRLRLYNEVRNGPNVDDRTKRNKLEAALCPCPMFSEAMNTAGTTERVSIAMDGQRAKLSFEQYYNVMMDGAINQDERYYLKHGFCVTNRKAKKAARAAKKAKQQCAANAAERKRDEYWLSDDVWSKMSHDERTKHIEYARKMRISGI